MNPHVGFGSKHAGTLKLELERLQNVGRVLYVAAHPDDENTRLIGYLAAAAKRRVAYLSLTRGDGGQNRIGDEQGDLLGVVRTFELERARSIDGGEQFFTRARDFGFSKSPEESISIWGHDDVLSDVVWVIRRYRPHVIITRFPEEAETHGHHLASAILAREAFSAAGDPDRFPEQLAEVSPWQPMRLMYNQPSFWRNSDDPSDLQLDVGVYFPELGLNLPELAAISRSSHRSQGFGSLPRYQRAVEHFDHVAGIPPEDSLFSGLDLSWSSEKGGKNVGEALAHALAGFESSQPQRALAGLVDAFVASNKLEDQWFRSDTQSQLGDLIATLIGLRTTFRAERPLAVPGETLKVSVDLEIQRPHRGIAIESVELRLGEDVLARPSQSEQIEVTIPKSAAVSQIDFLKPMRTTAEWSRSASTPLQGRVTLVYGGRRVSIERPVIYPGVDPVQGPRLQRVRVAPRFTVTPVQPVVMMLAGSTAPVWFRVRANQPAARGVLNFEQPDGLEFAPADAPLTFSRIGEEQLIGFEAQNVAGENQKIIPRIDGEAGWSREDLDYSHLEPTVVFQPASVRVVSVDLDSSGIAGPVAYVMGSGDRLPELLDQIGIDVELVDLADLSPAKLKRFHAVVLGVRAFNVHPELYDRVDALLGFAEQGGIVVVQYNVSSFFDKLPGDFGPYPFEIARVRVTDETAPVTIVDDAVQKPHILTDRDFEGWVQERGLYFAKSWDSRYRTPFEMADPGEEPLRGSTLIADIGKGRFIYTGLSFFRQLPAGVPGAYRLFINLLSR